MNILRNIYFYLKDYIEKIVWKYHSSEEYRNWLKKITYIVFLVNIVLYLFYLIFFSLNKDFDFWPFLTFSFCTFIAWISLGLLYTILMIPSDYIKPDIKNLPKKIWDYNVVIQYTPPKWLSASEVWLLYTLSWEWTNLECMFYKWEYEWLVRRFIDKEYWLPKIEIIKRIKHNIPRYERIFRWAVFWIKYDTYIFPDDLESNKYLSNFEYQQCTFEDYVKQDYRDLKVSQKALLNHCIEKWRIEVVWEGKTYLILSLFLYAFWFLISPILTFFICVFLIAFNSNRTWHIIDLWKLRRTKKWDELYAHIIWYKYFLERCDEKQLKAILEDDPNFKDKVLPYIIALRMNRRFLDKKYYK